MKTVSPEAPSPRVLMFGVQCAFTDDVAAGMVNRGLPPSALIVQGHPNLDRPVRIRNWSSTLPIADSRTTNVTSEYPTFQVGNLSSPPTLELIESFQPDLVVVACYPELIPRSIRNIPRWMSINVHPSLLPAHRGPDPLFWIMRDGGRGYGVTIHTMSGSFDAGDILAQRTIPYPDGARERDLNRILARAGADLVADVARLRSDGNLRHRSQHQDAATYESWPDEDDYLTTVDRPVLDAWNFVRGVSGRGIPVRIDTGSTELRVADATEYGTTATPPLMTNNECVVIRFCDGWLVARRFGTTPG